jgi:hypothetical protein
MTPRSGHPATILPFKLIYHFNNFRKLKIAILTYFMIVTSRTLLTLLVLEPCIIASGLDTLNNGAFVKTRAPQIPHDPVARDLTRRLSAVHLTSDNLEDIVTKGTILWSKTLNENMKVTATALDSEITKMIKQSKDFGPAVALIRGFFKASGNTIDQTIYNLVKAALKANAFDLLRTLQNFCPWSSPEQFHWFQALIYKSEWYDEKIWNESPTCMNWSKNITAIFMADNSIFFNDILAAKTLSSDSLFISNDALFDLIAKHDSFKIYNSLNLDSCDQLKARFGLLIESGSFQLLRIVQRFSGENLHLENYPFPEKLPSSAVDFEFLWTQGYRYMSASKFLKMACLHGRVDILGFFYRLDRVFQNPKSYKLHLAAKKGHLNVITWAMERDLAFDSFKTVEELAFNGYLKTFERAQKKLLARESEQRLLLKRAVQKDKLDVVKWLYYECGIVPESQDLGDANTEMLEWITLVDPQTIDETLAENASLNNLKWLSKNYPHLLTDKVKNAQNFKLVSLEKMQWMIQQKWTATPDMLEAARRGKAEILKIGYDSLRIKPTKNEALVAAFEGHIKVLKLIYSVDSSCIDKFGLSSAAEGGHLDVMKLLESILNLKGTAMNFNLCKAFSSGNLDLIIWTYQTYKLDQPDSSWLEKAIKNGHLNIIDWALKRQFIPKTNEGYLEIAASYNQYLIFQRLTDHGVAISRSRSLFYRAYESGGLEIVKYLVAEDPNIIASKCFAQATALNYHVWLWVLDQQRYCCIL